MTAGAWTLLVTCWRQCLAVWRWREGRIRRNETEDSVLNRLPDELAEKISADTAPSTQVVLLQLSTAFCAPCRHTRILLGDFAQRTEGVQHVEVDLTDHPEWSEPLGVHRTPTTLVLDRGGRELFRIHGAAPKKSSHPDAAAAVRLNRGTNSEVNRVGVNLGSLRPTW